MIYIIADDLTGATDTGVQLSKQGYNTIVSINDLSSQSNIIENQASTDSILVIDSETRELSGSEAKDRICSILANMSLTNDDIIYKKVDSTLRGNIGVEIEEIMNKLDRDLCIFTPAFPSNNRIVVGGNLLVDNQPLGESEYYEGELDSGDATHIPSLLCEKLNMEVSHIALKDVVKGPKNIFKKLKDLQGKRKQVIVVDAVTNNHLENILKGSMGFKPSVIYSGSAGLAAFLSHLNTNIIQDQDYISNPEKSPFLMVIGTRRKIINSQIEYLKEKIDVAELRLNIKTIYDSKTGYLKNYANKAVNELKQRRHLIIRPIPDSTSGINKLTSRELEIKVRDFLGKVTSMILNEVSVHNLMLTGGDTAIGVCKTLGIYRLEILEELLPGIPLSRPVQRKYSNMKIVTKAGGFGKDSTLYDIVKKYNKLEVRG